MAQFLSSSIKLSFYSHTFYTHESALYYNTDTLRFNAHDMKTLVAAVLDVAAAVVIVAVVIDAVAVVIVAVVIVAVAPSWVRSPTSDMACTSLHFMAKARTVFTTLVA